MIPPGAVGPQLPDSVADVEVTIDDADPAVLLLAALAYQRAGEALSRQAEQASMALWLRLRPVTDADMTEWMDGWNGLLDAAASRQSALTSTFARSTMGAFGVDLPDVIDVELDPDNDLDDALWSVLERWSLTGYADAASPSLSREIEQAQARIAAGRALLTDASLADRILNLGSPVVKARTELAGGAGDLAWARVAPQVGGMTYNAVRAAESVAVGATTWPKFKNGKAMLYRRVPQVGACGWCVIVATRLYSLESFKAGRAWHSGCRCSWTPVTATQAQTYASRVQRDGDYFAAAESIGAWAGPRPDNVNDFIRTTRAQGDASLGNG